MTYQTAERASAILARIDRRTRPARYLIEDANWRARVGERITNRWMLTEERIARCTGALRGVSALLAELEAQ